MVWRRRVGFDLERGDAMDAFVGFFMLGMLLVVLLSVRSSDKSDAEDEMQADENTYKEEEDE